MRKKSKDQGYLIVANRGGTQHTRSEDDVDGIYRRVMLWDKLGHGALPAQASEGEIKEGR